MRRSQGAGYHTFVTAEHPTASVFLPPRFTLRTLEHAARICAGCDLHHLGTQTVFGEGPVPAELMLVGEQPGDREDREGRPFVGPAGALLDAVLSEVGLARDQVYLTNAVKHFRWEGMRGKRRLHRKPSMVHVSACRPWLDAEISIVRPETLVCLGATAAQAILGRSFRLTEHRGEILDVDGIAPRVAATVHPASILRATSEGARQEQRAAFVDDLAGIVRSRREIDA
jgi:uracil-DNA glycosylase